MPSAKRTFTDQMGRPVQLAHPPTRIVSLVPSQTELLHYLELDEVVVGLTKFCVHPREWLMQKTRIGGTKNIDFEKIAQLQPDLIIGNKEENDQAQIEALAQDYPVWMSDITTLDDAFEMIIQLGLLTSREEKANALVDETRAAFDQLSQQQLPRKKALYFIWNKPIMAAGKATFIHQMMALAGFENCITDPASRYPELSPEAITALNPDVLMLSSEPYPFSEKHIAALQAQFPDMLVTLVDGELFSWYGSRMREAPAYFEELNRSTGQ